MVGGTSSVSHGCNVLSTFLSCNALAQSLERVPLMLYFCIMLVNTISVIKQRKLDLLPDLVFLQHLSIKGIKLKTRGRGWGGRGIRSLPVKCSEATNR